MDFELYLKSKIIKDGYEIKFNDLNFLYLLKHYNGIYNKMFSSYKNVDVNIVCEETKHSIDENIKENLFYNFINNLDSLTVEKINDEISFKIFNSFYNDLFNKRVISLSFRSKSNRQGKPRIDSDSLNKVYNLALTLLLKDNNIEISKVNPYSLSYDTFDFLDLLISLLKADFMLDNPLKLNEYNLNSCNNFNYVRSEMRKFISDKGFEYLINSLFRTESGKKYLIESSCLNSKYKSRLENVDFNKILDSGVFTNSCLDRLKIQYYEQFKSGNLSFIYIIDFLDGLDINKSNSSYLYDMYSRLVSYDLIMLFKKNLIRYLDIESSIDIDVVEFMDRKRK